MKVYICVVKFTYRITLEGSYPRVTIVNWRGGQRDRGLGLGFTPRSAGYNVR